MNIVERGSSRFRGLGVLFFLISNLYRFIIAVLLFSALPTACGFCGYMVVSAEAGILLVSSERATVDRRDEVVGIKDR